jgi:hypothetical protein
MPERRRGVTAAVMAQPVERADIPASCPAWCKADHHNPEYRLPDKHAGQYIEVILAEGNRFVAQLWGSEGNLKLSLQFSRACLYDDDHECPFDPENYHEVNLALPTASADLALILPAIEAVMAGAK